MLALLLEIWSENSVAVFFSCILKRCLLTCQLWQLFIVHAKCRFSLQIVFIVQSLSSTFGLFSIYLSLYSDRSCQEQWAFAVSELGCTFHNYNLSKFWPKCKLGVFILKAISSLPEAGASTAALFHLFFFNLLHFFTAQSVRQIPAAALHLQWHADDVRIKARCSSCSQPLLGCSLSFCPPTLPFIPLSFSVASVIVSLFILAFKPKIKMTLANQCSSSVVPPVLFSLILCRTSKNSIW